jgi:hypothetical protein
VTRTLKLVLLCGLLFVPCLALAASQAKIKIGKVTLRPGMPQAKALRSLRRANDLSVVEDHADAYLIKQPKNGEILGSVQFKESKLVSASKSWNGPPSAQLASAPFANAVFEAVGDLTEHERSSCTVVTTDADPIELSVTNVWSGEPVFYPAPGTCGAACRNNHAYITCGKKTAIIDDVTVKFPVNLGYDVTSHVGVRVNYKGGPLYDGYKTVDGYKGPIRVGTVTVQEGMPEEQALQLLRGSPGISASKVYEAPPLGQSWIFITGASTHSLISGPNGFECDDGIGRCPLTFWSVLFEASKVSSVSKSWILSQSASARAADALFEDLKNLTGRFSLSVACTVETADRDPNLHESTFDSSVTDNILPVVKQVSFSCGNKHASISITTTAAGNNSSIAITEGIFVK